MRLIFILIFNSTVFLCAQGKWYLGNLKGVDELSIHIEIDSLQDKLWANRIMNYVELSLGQTKIRIDKEFTVAASGYLQNSDDIGKGYSKRKKPKSKKGKAEWHFVAPKVHDFTWSADKNYIHDIYPGPNEVKLHFFYKNDPKIIDNWINDGVELIITSGGTGLGPRDLTIETLDQEFDYKIPGIEQSLHA